jgi:hypothetical protein
MRQAVAESNVLSIGDFRVRGRRGLADGRILRCRVRVRHDALTARRRPSSGPYAWRTAANHPESTNGENQSSSKQGRFELIDQAITSL